MEKWRFEALFVGETTLKNKGTVGFWWCIVTIHPRSLTTVCRPDTKKWWQRSNFRSFPILGAKCVKLWEGTFSQQLPTTTPRDRSKCRNLHGHPYTFQCPVFHAVGQWAVSIFQSPGVLRKTQLWWDYIFCVNGGGVNFLVIVLIYVHICLEGTRIIHLDIYILHGYIYIYIYIENTSTYRGALCNSPNVGNTSFRPAWFRLGHGLTYIYTLSLQWPWNFRPGLKKKIATFFIKEDLFGFYTRCEDPQTLEKNHSLSSY